MNKIGLYLRVSTEEQARILEGSLLSQRQRLNEYVRYQNQINPNYGMIVDTYCDEAKSAKDLNRPEFQRLLQDIKRGRIDLLLATDLSRISRSMRDFCRVWDFLKEHGAKFVTLRDQFDTTTASGEMMVFNLMNFSQYERKQTSERLKANFEARANRGLWNGGVIPLGYKRNPDNKGTLLVDEEGKAQLQLIFEIFLEKKNLRQTCLELNHRGLRTRSYVGQSGTSRGGSLFTVPSLHKILTNPTPLGLREIHKKKKTRHTVQGKWDAILDPKVFHEVQSILQKNRTRYKPSEWKTYTYPLTGIATCGECGLKLNGKSAHGKTKRHHYYDHPRTLKSFPNGDIHDCKVQRLRAEVVENELTQALQKIISEPKYINSAIQSFHEHHTSSDPILKQEAKKIDQNLKDTTRKIKTLIDRMSDLPKEISIDPIVQKLTELQTKEKTLKESLLTLESKTKSYDSTVSSDQLKNVLTRALANLNVATKEQTKTIFENTLQYVKLDGGEKMRLGVYVPTSESNQSQDEKKGAASNGGSHFAKRTGFENGVIASGFIPNLKLVPQTGLDDVKNENPNRSGSSSFEWA